MVDLSKFTFDKKILSKIVALRCTNNFVVKLCPLSFVHYLIEFEIFFCDSDVYSVFNPSLSLSLSFIGSSRVLLQLGSFIARLIKLQEFLRLIVQMQRMLFTKQLSSKGTSY